MTENEIPSGVSFYRSKEISGGGILAPSVDWLIEYPDGSLDAWEEVLSAHPRRKPDDPNGDNIDLDNCREVDRSEFPDEILQSTLD